MRKRHADARRLARLTDEVRRLGAEIAEGECALIEIQNKERQKLDNLAALIWNAEEYVASHTAFNKKNQFAPISAADFEKQFTLVIPGEGFQTRKGDVVLTDQTVDSQRAIHVLLYKIIAKSKSFPPEHIFRKISIELAPFVIRFEAWAYIFQYAALMEDFDFIERSVARYREKPSLADDRDICEIVTHWYVGPAERIPPLKYWSDKAACEFIHFKSGKNSSLSAYKVRKSRIDFHSEKPTLVSVAELKYEEGGTRRLACRR
jgi:hypothetical protein